eukprot:15484125-Alexandrium_andersonii.AAC.1
MRLPRRNLQRAARRRAPYERSVDNAIQYSATQRAAHAQCNARWRNTQTRNAAHSDVRYAAQRSAGATQRKVAPVRFLLGLGMYAC